MAIETEFTDLYAQLQDPTLIIASDQQSSRLVAMTFRHTQKVTGDAGSRVLLLRTPPGRSRLLTLQSAYVHSTYGIGRTATIGWLAYRDEHGQEQPENITGIVSNVSFASEDRKNLYVNVGNFIDSVLMETPRILAVQVNGGTIPIGAVLNGTFTFALG